MGSCELLPMRNNCAVAIRMALVGFFVFLSLSGSAAATSSREDPASCSSTGDMAASKSSSCLMQAAARPKPLSRPEEMQSEQNFLEQEGAPVELSADLHQLGVELFGEEDLNKIVAESQAVDATVFDVKLKLRIKKDDNAISRLPDEGKTDEYGVKEILDGGATPHGMINVIDMGANYGIVPIALFHTYPKYVRAVILEPIPVTYFFLRWNLELNGVPALTEDEIRKTGKERTPGVMALHMGVAEDDKNMSFCWSTDNSMNAAMCDCKNPPFPGAECLTIATISTGSLLDLFGQNGVDFLKMDCEGCELHSLPALDKMESATTLVRRLVGELHEVPPELEDIACKFNHKTWMTKVCTHPIGAGQLLECDPKTRDKNCYKEVPWPRP
mmetsp:Transcript_123752/g.231556  ORF Transcript_123752/g.231556 Transcript_123752/m.231556 type:complete len:386 (-) Transcript_123752:140-1297(-)